MNHLYKQLLETLTYPLAIIGLFANWDSIKALILFLLGFILLVLQIYNQILSNKKHKLDIEKLKQEKEI